MFEIYDKETSERIMTIIVDKDVEDKKAYLEDLLGDKYQVMYGG